MLKVQITKNGLTPFKIKVSAEDVGLTDEAGGSKFIDEIAVTGEIDDSGSLCLAKGRITCKKSFLCDRCLEPSIKNQIHDFNEEIGRDEIEEDIVDLTNIIRDTIITSQPIKNLCKDDCKGLCPICGVNLNESECGCNRFVADPRLAVLENLL